MFRPFWCNTCDKRFDNCDCILVDIKRERDNFQKLYNDEIDITRKTFFADAARIKELERERNEFRAKATTLSLETEFLRDTLRLAYEDSIQHDDDNPGVKEAVRMALGEQPVG